MFDKERTMNEMRILACLALGLVAFCACGAAPARAQSERPSWMGVAVAGLETELAAKYGDGARASARRGMEQVASFWRAEDGDRAVFEEFVRASFAGDAATRDAIFERFERVFDKLDGHMHEIGTELRRQADLDLGPILPVDEIFAGYSPSAHVSDDFFANKISFVALLNFPLTTLEERVAKGAGWSRREWAEVRLAQRFSRRVPASVNLAVAKISAGADAYVASYNIWMHHLLDDAGARLFPAGMRLLTHWNLRDELKANYRDAAAGPAKQRMIMKVMERIVTQTIPRAVVDNPAVDWNPYTNEVAAAAVKDADVEPDVSATNEREPDTRYATLLSTFKASRLVDPYSPTAPTLIARRFDESREIPEERVRAMLEQVCSSPLVSKVARLIEQRLGRSLEPYDIWYSGFRPASPRSGEELDGIVAAKYPTPEAFERDIPNILVKLGFDRGRAEYIARHIAVEPARGSGHASGAGMKGGTARLRTRVRPGGMDYKGFNIAIHELGHNVEQVLSINDVDHTLLQGVPNTAFTEAFAFLFQARDLALLDLPVASDETGEAMRVLNDFWGTYEIAGVSLVDMAVWHWMYEHPDATPAELRDAVLGIAKGVWNRYYAPVFRKKDVVLLAVYSHMIDSYLYLPDYPMGHLISAQIEKKVAEAGSIGPEFERMATFGAVLPDLWMRNATGSPVGAEALLAETADALKIVSRKGARK
jgi:hypothetical protein